MTDAKNLNVIPPAVSGTPEPSAPKRRSAKGAGAYRIIKWIVFVIFVVYAVSLLFPFFWMLFNSVKPNGEFLSGNVFGLPSTLTFANYSYILSYTIGGESILKMFFTSVVLTVSGTFVNVFFSTIAAYCVAKYRFPGRGAIMAVAIFTMIMPIVGTLPAQVQMMELFRLDDSMLGVLFLYSGCFGFNFILMHSSFESISWTYAEAAQIDGANRADILFRIMLPIAGGPIVAVCVLQAINVWNDYSTPLLFMPSQKTLAVGLQKLQGELSGRGGNYPGIFAAVIVAVLPIFALYACFQKKILENTVAGGLKG